MARPISSTSLGDQRVAVAEMNEHRAVGLAPKPAAIAARGRPGKAAGGDHLQASLDQLAAGRLALEGSGAGERDFGDVH